MAWQPAFFKQKKAKSKQTANVSPAIASAKTEEQVTQFHRAWQNWADGTTLHGIKYVFDGESFFVRRVFWLLVIIGFIYYLSHSVIVQFQRFYEYKTVTRTSIIMEDSLEFPAITICNFNMVQNESVTDPKTRELLKEMYLEEIVNISAIYNLGEEFLSTVNIHDIFMNGRPKLSNTFRECRWIKETLPCENVLTKRRTRKGYCYTFGAKESNRSYSVQTTGIKAGVRFMLYVGQKKYFIGEDESAGVQIVIHDVDEEPDLNLGINLSPGYTHYIGLSKEEQIFLPDPVKAFGKRKCTDTKKADFRNHLKFYEDYSLNACMAECRSDYMNETCGCIGPFDPGNYRQCSPMEILICVDYVVHNFRLKFDFDACKCPFPCHVTTYHTMVTSAYYPNNNWLRITIGEEKKLRTKREWLRDNFLQLRVYFETFGTKRREQILKFTQEDLISSFGGFLGLCIGASLITLLEFLEFCALSLFHCIKKKAHEKREGDKVLEIKKGQGTGDIYHM